MNTLPALPRFLAIFALAVAPIPSPAPAHANGIEHANRYYVNFHFAGHAYGKQVAAVYAHTGVLTAETSAEAAIRGRPEQSYWQDVQHFPLVRNRDHYFGSTQLRGHSRTDGPWSGMMGVIVEYWIYFTDGTLRISPQSLVRVATDFGHVDPRNESLARRVRDAISRYERAQDAQDSSCIVVGEQFLLQ